jgi:glycosyltransferase involved in cell wall biosynthesis
MPLVVLGNYERDDSYHQAVQAVASDEVRFLGAVHDPDVVGSLRRHTAVYLHGHTVGGTNPSLVEAMAAGNAIVARRNVYNTWVAGEGALYFSDEAELDAALTFALDPDTSRELGRKGRERFEAEFTWERIGSQYEQALQRAKARHGRREARTPA